MIKISSSALKKKVRKNEAKNTISEYLDLIKKISSQAISQETHQRQAVYKNEEKLVLEKKNQEKFSVTKLKLSFKQKREKRRNKKRFFLSY